MKWIQPTGRFLLRLAMRFIDDGLSYRAASLVYNSLLSMVPLAIVMIAVLSLFPIFHGVGDSVQKFVFDNFVTSSAQQIVQQLQHFMSQVQNLSWITISFLVITAVFMMTNINDTFNAIWHLPSSRNFFVTFAIYVLFVLVAPILIGSGVVISTFLFSLPFISAVGKLPQITHFTLFLLPYVFTWIVFTLMNWILPSCRVHFLSAMLGGFISTVLFELLKWGFAQYVRYSTTYQDLYGALAMIPFFLLWLYCGWVVVLFGAVISHEAHEAYQRRHGSLLKRQMQ